MKILILLILFSLTFTVSGKPSKYRRIDCKIHKIYCAMKKLRPKLGHVFTLNLSNSMHRWSKFYYIDPIRSVAILMQESYLGYFKNRMIKGVVKTEVCEKDLYYLASYHPDVTFNPKCETVYKVVDVLADLSIWQFQPATAIRHGMDLARLQTDIDYATRQHFRVMKIKHKMGTCKKKWPNSKWACYHSTSNKHHRKYVKDVNKWYKKIKE
jgi:hypothetical protein